MICPFTLGISSCYYKEEKPISRGPSQDKQHNPSRLNGAIKKSVVRPEVGCLINHVTPGPILLTVVNIKSKLKKAFYFDS